MKELSPTDEECAKCPKYDTSKLWCPIRAEARQPTATACHYGAVLMGDENQKEYRNGRGEKEA